MKKIIKENYILLLIIIIPFSPIIFTLPTFTGIAFNELGQIGDVIEGTTAPFIGLLSIYLVYKAFRIQVYANEKLNDFNKDNSLRNDIETLENFRKNEIKELITTLYDETASIITRIELNQKNEDETIVINKLFNQLNESGYFFLILLDYHSQYYKKQSSFTPGELRMKIYVESILKNQLLDLYGILEGINILIGKRKKQINNKGLEIIYDRVSIKIEDYILTTLKIIDPK